MQIKRGDKVIADVFIKKSSYTLEEINGQHVACLEFDILSPVEFTVNDHIEYMGNTYYIRYKESITKEETSLGYSYRMTLYHELYRMYDVAFFLYDQPDFRKNMSFYTGNAAQILPLIATSMNRVDSGWTVGSVIETKTLTFNFKDKTCADVLQELLNTYETEYWVEGKVINFGKRERSSNGLVLSQGKGFRSLTLSSVDDTPPITRLYAYGSDANLHAAEYDEDYLHLPDGAKYIEKNVDKYGVIEHVRQFENVRPQGTFEVTEKIDDLTLCAAGIDFNLTDQLLGDGVEVMVTFQDGGLSGYDLAIENGSWNNERKLFKLVRNREENALEVPGAIHFNVGDHFILTGLKMPQSYIDKAEQELLTEAQRWLDEKCENRMQLNAVCDEIYFAEEDVYISCGQMIGIYNAKLAIDREIRVTAVKRYIERDDENPYRYEITISDFLQGNGLSRIINDIKDIPNQIERESGKNKEYTKRRYADVMQTMAMMYDPEGDYFTELIKPLVVHTAQLIVGTNSQQMAFTGVKFVPNRNGDPNLFGNTAGRLDHFTINSDGTVRTWNIVAGNYAINNNNAYYVYAKCPRSNANGSIYLTIDKIIVDSDASYYHFLIGVLNTPIENIRSWQPTYGYTEIAGNQITTGIIKDRSGNLVIDLDKGTITGYGRMTDKPDLSGYDDAVAKLQMLDGQIKANVQSINSINGTIKEAGWTTTANGNILYAFKDNMITMINQSEEEIQINASRISLNGKVTLAMFDPDMQNIIHTAQDAAGTADAAFANAVNANTATSTLQKILFPNDSEYQALVASAQSGKTTIEGGYIRSELIEVNTVFANTVLANAAKIGGFSIENGWLVANSTEHGGYIMMRGPSTSIAFGYNLIPATAGGAITRTAAIENNNTSEDYGQTIALSLKASGRANSSGVTLSEPIALDASGGVVIKGCFSVIEKIYSTLNSAPFSTTNASILKHYNAFSLQPSSNFGVGLPNRTTIEKLFGLFNDGVGVGYGGIIKITLIMSRYASGFIDLQGDSSTPLLDNNGNVMAYRRMEKGDVIQVGYMNGAWYTLNFQN